MSAKIEKPNIHRDLTAKYLATRRLLIQGIITHDTAGSGTHNDTKYLANPSDGRKVSVDFTVERDGSIWQLNPDLKKYCCSHAGRHTKFQQWRDGQVNHATVGIEIVQKANLSLVPVYTDEQVKAVAHLCAWLCQEFNLEPSDISTHRQVITDGSRSDPRKFPFEGDNGFWFYFNEARGTLARFEISQTHKIIHAPQPEFTDDEKGAEQFQDSPVASETVETSQEKSAGQIQQSASVPVPQGADETTVEVKKESVSIFTKVKTTVGAAFAGLAGLGLSYQAFFDRVAGSITYKHVLVIMLMFGGAAFCLWLYDRSSQRAHDKTMSKMEAAKNQSENNVELK